MTVFARVATVRSFSAAARELGISQATASKHVQTLETSLGTRLLHRTTRRVALTDAGMNFYAQCTRILEDMENAWQAGQTTATLRGSLRITAPVAFGSTRLATLLADFMQQNPDLSLTVSLTNRSVDVVEERVDLAIRIGPSPPGDPGIVVHPLLPLRVVLCAAPLYLQIVEPPETPADLVRLSCLTDDSPHATSVWRFTGPDGESDVTVSGRLKTNSAMLRRKAALDAAGVLLSPEFMVADDIAVGRLIRLLPDYTPAALRLDAVCPAVRATSPRLGRLLAFLTEHLGPS